MKVYRDELFKVFNLEGHVLGDIGRPHIRPRVDNEIADDVQLAIEHIHS